MPARTLRVPLDILIMAASSAGSPAATINAGILGREFVIVLAVRLPRVNGGQPVAPENVLAVGDRLEVRRVDAMTNPAEMVKFQSFGDFATRQLIDKAVRLDTLSPMGRAGIAARPKLPDP